MKHQILLLTLIVNLTHSALGVETSSTTTKTTDSGLRASRFSLLLHGSLIGSTGSMSSKYINDSSESREKYKLQPFIGAGAHFIAASPSNETFKIESGLDYVNRGVLITKKTSRAVLSFRYLELPVLLRVYPIPQNKVFYFSAGPTLAVRLNGAKAYDPDYQYDIKLDQSSERSTQYVRRVVLGFQANIGSEIPLKERLALNLGIGLYTDLTPTINLTPVSWYTRSINATAGLAFAL